MCVKRMIALVLFSLPLAVPAQYHLSLDDCIRRAVDANPELENERLECRVKRNDYVEAIGGVMPEVTAETRFGKRFGRVIDPGTNLFATNDFVEGNLSLNVSVPLFEGFTRINKIIFQRINKQAGAWTVAYRENEIAFGVMDAFYRVAFQRQLLALAVEQRRLSEAYLEQAREFVNEGLKAAVDLQEMKSRVSSDVYQETVRRNACQVAVLELKQLLWLSPGDSLGIVLPSEAAPIPVALSVQAVYDESTRFLPQLQLMELRLKASQKSLAIAGGKFSPSLRGEIGLYTGYYDTERNEQGSVVSWGKQLDNNLNRYYGLTLSLPIITGFRNITGVRKARLKLEQTQNSVVMEQQRLYTEIESACLALQAATDELRYAGETEVAEKMTLQQMEEKWKEGLISVFELMESRNRYFTARAEVIRTRLQYGIKQKTVDFFQGTPLVKAKNEK